MTTRTLAVLGLALLAGGCAGLDSFYAGSFQGCSQVMPYRFGERVYGELTFDDCVLPDDPDRSVDYYELRVDRTLDEARLRAGDEGVDPVLILYRRDGTELGRNDDITLLLNTSARVQRRLTPGVYIIAITSAADDAVGAYELSATVERD